MLVSVLSSPGVIGRVTNRIHSSDNYFFLFLVIYYTWYSLTVWVVM